MNTIKLNTRILAVALVVAFGCVCSPAFAATRTAESGDTVSGYVGGDPMAWYVFQVLNNQEEGAAEITNVNLIITGKEYFAPSSELMTRIIDKIKDAGFYDKDSPGFHDAVLSALSQEEIANSLQQERNDDSGEGNSEETNTENENTGGNTEVQAPSGNEISLLDGNVPDGSDSDTETSGEDSLFVGKVDMKELLSQNMEAVAEPKTMPVEDGAVYAANSPEVSQDSSLWDLIANFFKW